MTSIRRLLIPNRGEIALRIIRTARALGIETVVAHSAADSDSLPVRSADRAVLLGPAPARESYLSVERILDAARRCGADALHPGYGFLSEREELARGCEEAGLIFVGPTPENVRALGDKLAARRLLEPAGIAIVGGESTAIADLASLKRAAARIGFPLLIKAAAGGGGKGIRKVRSEKELEAAYRLSASEAQGAFGDGTVFAERFLEGARHVEVQVLGDGKGGVRVFPERDCSLQRRYQKLLEETPCPAVEAAPRERLLRTAARIAALARYRGAGTVEFLHAPDGGFYFLEVNTRLQVEHPITEMVCGVDLVAEQIAIAEGKTFPPGAVEIAEHRGAAIEMRVNAEDPELSFRPATGRVTALRLPGGPGVRVDTALYRGLEVTPHYDSLLAKLIAWGSDRDQSRRRLLAAAEEFRLEGLATTLSLVSPLLERAEIREGRYHTGTLERLLAEPEFLRGAPLQGEEREAAAVIAAILRARCEGRTGSPEILPATGAAAAPSRPLSPWVRTLRDSSLQTGLRPGREFVPEGP